MSLYPRVMELREFIGRIGRTYDRGQGTAVGVEAQDLLRRAAHEIQKWVPAGYRIDASGGQGSATFVPWIGVFDPDETTSAQAGIYVVYLYAADMERVYLTLNQGVTIISNDLGLNEARKQLRARAGAIRESLPSRDIGQLERSIFLKTKASTPVSYVYGNIVAKGYNIANLPSEREMVSDLRDFVKLYEVALAKRADLGISRDSPGSVGAQPRLGHKSEDDLIFKPKDDGDYLVEAPKRSQVKTRKHETVVKEFGEYVKGRGLIPGTNVHPRDLVVRSSDGREWLVEVKVVRRGDGVSAAREALAQLCEYRFAYHSNSPNVDMVAVFNEDVGEFSREFLEAFGVASVWWNGPQWLGSPLAAKSGIWHR
jgi:hypothetical protein